MINIGHFLGKFIKNSSQKELGRLKTAVEKINTLEPSIKEMSDESFPAKTMELKSKIKKYNIGVLTISIDKKNIKDQLEFLLNNGASNLDHFFDKEMKIFKALKLRGIPTTIIVNQNSFIISKHEGILKWGEDEIINKIKSLFY